MYTIVIYHRLPRKGKRPCDYALARVRIPRRELAHAAAWQYQRTRFGGKEPPLCGGCGGKVGNQIAFSVEVQTPLAIDPRHAVPRVPLLALLEVQGDP